MKQGDHQIIKSSSNMSDYINVSTQMNRCHLCSKADGYFLEGKGIYTPVTYPGGP
jgi:hypothetical protein